MSAPGGEPPPQSLWCPLPSLRRTLLEQTLQQAEFLHNCEEEETWLREHEQLVEDEALGRDLSQIRAALQKHKVRVTLGPAPVPTWPCPSLPFPSLHPALHPARPWKPSSATTRPCALISCGGDATWEPAGTPRGQTPGSGPRHCRARGSGSGPPQPGGALGCRRLCSSRR